MQKTRCPCTSMRTIFECLGGVDLVPPSACKRRWCRWQLAESGLRALWPTKPTTESALSKSFQSQMADGRGRADS